MATSATLSDEDSLLLELMLQTEILCNEIESAAKGFGSALDLETIRLKVSQCRGALACLQEAYEKDEFSADRPYVCATFRIAVVAVLWLAFYARDVVTLKCFRRMVKIESGFTYLLITRPARSAAG